MRFTFSASAILLCATVAISQETRSHAVTVEDYFTLATPTEVALSPDTQRVAYTDLRWKKSTNDRKADLWVVGCDDGKTTRLTTDRPGARGLRWSADGKSIYYLGSRKRAGEKGPPYDGSTQVWKTPIDGGATTAVTRVPGGVVAYQLDAKETTLVYLLSKSAAAIGPFAKLRQEFSQLEYDDNPGSQVSEIWKLDLSTWRSEKILDNGRVAREIALTPEGHKLAMITTPDDTVVSFEGQSRVEVLDLASKKLTVLPDKCYRAAGASPYGWLEHVVWGPGPKNRLAFNVIFDGYPAEVILGEDAGKGWDTWKAVRPSQVHVGGYGSPLCWADRDHVLFVGEEKGRARLWSINARDHKAVAAPSPLHPANMDIAINALDIVGSRCAVLAATPTTFREVWLLGDKQKPMPITRLNPQAANWKLPRVSTVSWKGADGVEVEGILELPADVRQGQPLPLIVAIHGGPTMAVRYQMEYDLYLGKVLLPARGYAVLSPNYRGSTGYGDKFLTGLIGKENDLDVGDILAGVDDLVARKIADPNRLGVMGWSNGGYLTNCVISKTTRFKAASSGAGIVDAVMQWGSNDEPAYMAVLKGGLPWEIPEVFRRTSPTYSLDKIRTPTIIHVGANDVRCPPSQSRMLFRALKVYNKVPTELVVYPGEPHGLGTYASRRAKMLWDLAWFDRYVLEKK